MPRNKPPSEAAFARAAELRSSGHSWEVVGRQLRRSGETVRKWPTMYPERWTSITAYGIGAGSTGTRADLLVCDDVVDVRSLHNRAERDRVGDHFHDNLMNLLEPEGRFWGLFTPWHANDLNARLKKNPVYLLDRREPRVW